VDIQRPAVAITTPILGQRVLGTNAVYTVRGTATDNGGVASVWVQANGGDWTNAVGTNMWSVTLPLNAGPNTVRAYSRDLTGNYSPTSGVVTFSYVVTSPMTVRINGAGTVAPNYNGAQLEVNQPYSMTATPGLGFALTNWTDAVDVIVTNKPAISFKMSSNLVLQANFVDIQRPAVAITTPILGQRVLGTNAVYTVRGTATDNGGVASVWVQANGGDWTNAVGTNMWSVTLPLNAGPNTVRAYSRDLTGNYSPTSGVVTFSYVVTSPMTVRINGAGTVAPNYNGAQLEVNQPYSMTATPGLGFALTNWTDAVDVIVTNKPAISFKMSSNLVLQANFVDIQRPLVAITTPTLGQRVLGTNESFTVRGTASDNGGVSEVKVRVNGGDWINAVGTNVWMVTVNLNPGTNAVEASSVDEQGNFSLITKVLCTYLEILPEFEYNGHNYRLVSADKSTWAAAKTAAEASLLNGRRGHLAIIETPEENAAIFEMLNPLSNPDIDKAMPYSIYAHPDSGSRGVWIGASDSASSISLASEGKFAWIPHGLIASQIFWKDGIEGAVVFGLYANWGNSAGAFEPDNWSGSAARQQNHVALQIDSWPYGAAGQWNDLDGNIPQAYLIEYEDEKQALSLLTQEGVEALSMFADTNSIPRGAPELLAIAAEDFDLVARSNPTDYTNRIYNALTIMLNLVNDSTVRSQAEDFGLNLNDLFNPTCILPEVMPSVDGSVDNLALSVLPAIDKAFTELNAVPATWLGRIEISPSQFPIDDAVWVDIGDVTAMKAGLKGLRAFVGLAKAYSLNIDYKRLLDPIETPQKVIAVDGLVTDWADVPTSLRAIQSLEDFGMGGGVTVTQEVAVALDGDQIALLMTGCPFAQQESFLISFDLCLSNGDGMNANRNFTVAIQSDGLDFYGYINDQPFGGFEIRLVDGVLELKFSRLDLDVFETSQVTVEYVDCWSYWMSFELESNFDTPIQTLRANHPEFLSKIRNTASLAGVKTDVLAALDGYLSADTLIANRTGENALLLHLIDFDATDPEAVEDRLDKKLAVQTIKNSLIASVQLEGDSSIEGTDTRPVYLGAFFNAPFITTNALPATFGGTLSELVYGIFPNPTFNGMLPGMTSDMLNKYLLGYTYASVETLTFFQNNESLSELKFYVETERKLMVITNVTVSGPGIPLTVMTQWGGEMSDEWNGFAEVVSKPPVGSLYTFTVYFSDGSRELVYSKIKAWLAFSSVPTVSGSTLWWPAVAGVDRYEVWVGGTHLILPKTQTSLNLTPYGYEPGNIPYIWIEALDDNWNCVGSTAKVLN